MTRKVSAKWAILDWPDGQFCVLLKPLQVYPRSPAKTRVSRVRRVPPSLPVPPVPPVPRFSEGRYSEGVRRRSAAEWGGDSVHPHLCAEHTSATADRFGRIRVAKHRRQHVDHSDPKYDRRPGALHVPTCIAPDPTPRVPESHQPSGASPSGLVREPAQTGPVLEPQRQSLPHIPTASTATRIPAHTRRVQSPPAPKVHCTFA
jgi:hypothetical protein